MPSRESELHGVEYENKNAAEGDTLNQAAKKATILILAGGTGGHVYPALAVARELNDIGHMAVWMGTRKGLEARVVPQAGLPVEWLSVAGIRGKGWFRKLAAPFMLIRACWQAGSIIRKVKPDVVLGMGGFVSGPGGVMARLLGIPLIIHEQNRVPGTTNRLLAKWASRVLEAFPGSFPQVAEAQSVGNPLRREIASINIDKPGKSPTDALNIMVMGGSLGAKALNETVPLALAMVGRNLNIRHQTGVEMRDETAARYEVSGTEAKVLAYVEDMGEAYRWADLVICRSGAMTVSELAAAGLPAVLVPYPHAIDDHQTRNAHYLTDAGAAVLLPQGEMTAQRLAGIIEEISGVAGRLKEMGQKAKTLARPEAARTVARYCLDYAEKGSSKLESK